MNRSEFKLPDAGAGNHPKEPYKLSPLEHGAKPEPPQRPPREHPDLSWGDLNEVPSSPQEVPADQGDGFIDFAQPSSSPFSGAGGEPSVTDEHAPTIPPPVH